MRVLHLIPGREEGASMIFSKNQVRDIAEAGVLSRVAYLENRSGPLALSQCIRQIKAEINSFKPTVLHAHYGTITAFAASLAKGTIPLVITFHGSDLNKTSSDGTLRDLAGRIMSNLAAARASMNICVSKALISKLWFGKTKAVVIPVGVNIDTFKPMDRKICREQLGWSLSEQVILFNGNNPAVKQTDLALAVVNKLRNETPSIRLEIMKGEVDPLLVPVLINASDCVLLCSKSEGSPMIVKEALACNVPVVGVDVGDVKERLQYVTNSIVADSNVEALAGAVKRVLNLKIDGNGREQVFKQKIDSNSLLHGLIEIYKSVI